jgi:hypothetical protein
VGQARAQTGSSYTNRQLKSIQNRNSAAAFTSQRLNNRVFSRTAPTFAYSNVNRNLFDSARGRQKPFSSYTPGPSVSPYLALSAPFTSTATNYYTQVRPQIEQQRINEQMAQRNAALQRQLNAIAAQGPYDPQGSDVRAPTGHAAVFMNYGGYYTMPPPKF